MGIFTKLGEKWVQINEMSDSVGELNRKHEGHDSLIGDLYTANADINAQVNDLKTRVINTTSRVDAYVSTRGSDVDEHARDIIGETQMFPSAEAGYAALQALRLGCTGTWEDISHNCTVIGSYTDGPVVLTRVDRLNWQDRELLQNVGADTAPPPPHGSWAYSGPTTAMYDAAIKLGSRSIPDFITIYDMLNTSN